MENLPTPTTMKKQINKKQNKVKRYIRITSINNISVYIPSVIYNYISQKDIENVVKDINYANNYYSTIYEKKIEDGRVFLSGAIFNTFEEAANKFLSTAVISTLNKLKIDEQYFKELVEVMSISCLDKKEEDDMVVCIY